MSAQKKLKQKMVTADPRVKLRSSASIFGEVTTTFDSLASWYNVLGSGGFLIVSGIVIILLTIVLSFVTGTGDQPQAYGITQNGAIIFAVFAIILCALGVFSTLRKNAIISKEKMHLIDLEIEQTKFELDLDLKRLDTLARLTAGTDQHRQAVEILARRVYSEEIEESG